MNKPTPAPVTKSDKPKQELEDGVYRVEYGTITAGFVVDSGRVTSIAPVLRKNFEFFKTKAKRVGD